MQVFPTAPSPTVTHLMNLAVLMFEVQFLFFTLLAKPSSSLNSLAPLVEAHRFISLSLSLSIKFKNFYKIESNKGGYRIGGHLELRSGGGL